MTFRVKFHIEKFREYVTIFIYHTRILAAAANYFFSPRTKRELNVALFANDASIWEMYLLMEKN